jgi:hypothetical protein
MKKTTVATRARRKLVVRAEAIATLAPADLVAVVGGETDRPLSKPPNCGTTGTTH